LNFVWGIGSQCSERRKKRHGKYKLGRKGWGGGKNHFEQKAQAPLVRGVFPHSPSEKWVLAPEERGACGVAKRSENTKKVKKEKKQSQKKDGGEALPLPNQRSKTKSGVSSKTKEKKTVANRQEQEDGEGGNRAWTEHGQKTKITWMQENFGYGGKDTGGTNGKRRRGRELAGEAKKNHIITMRRWVPVQRVGPPGTAREKRQLEEKEEN